ncbi:MAG TPA: histidine phosphatase family protein [Candidatus Xenobia bacterium]|jgi:broad specificity phosphatase PhoE
MTTVYLVRHAEPANPRQVHYGRLPRFRLSDAGRVQAEALGQRLSTIRADAIYSSPLLRARQTAAALARYQPGVRVAIRRGLIEVRNPVEGTPFTEVPLGTNLYEPPMPGIESMAEQGARMRHTMEALVRAHPDGTVFAVSHGDPIAVLLLGYRGLPLTREALRQNDYPALASITRLIYAGGSPSICRLPPPSGPA